MPVVDWDHLTKEQERLFVEAIRIFARRGRQLREAEEKSCDAPTADEAVRDAATANAAYEGMTAEERGIAVYEKWTSDELSIGEMTELEWWAWMGECKRQSQRTRNLIWNADHHRYFLERVGSMTDKLTEDEQQAIIDLLQSCQWGDSEVAQVKEMIETAEWFSKLRAE